MTHSNRLEHAGHRLAGYLEQLAIEYGLTPADMVRLLTHYAADWDKQMERKP